MKQYFDGGLNKMVEMLHIFGKNENVEIWYGTLLIIIISSSISEIM